MPELTLSHHGDEKVHVVVRQKPGEKWVEIMALSVVEAFTLSRMLQDYANSLAKNPLPVSVPEKVFKLHAEGGA
jgi:hypothetical protein